MGELILGRHAQAFANLGLDGDGAAFGNLESPLTPKGIEEQCPAMRARFIELGIVPEEYTERVAASEYERPQQTAREIGFRADLIDPLAMLNEPDFSVSPIRGDEVMKKHAREHWGPKETLASARGLIDLAERGKFGYRIGFSHGIFIACVRLALEEQGHPMMNDLKFDPVRGYIPWQAEVTVIEL